MSVRVSGTLFAPPSKSMAQRAIAAASLATGRSRIFAGTFSEDIEAGVNVIRALGSKVRISEENGQNCIEIKGGGEATGEDLNCGEAGLSMRMFSSLAALSKHPTKLTGRGSLLIRPMNAVQDILSSLGAEVSLTGNFAPIFIKGPLRSGKITIDGSLSSQFLTGLLIALPTLPGSSEIQVLNLKSKPYIKMTLELIADFGVQIEADEELAKFVIPGNQKYSARDYVVEGDWSGASFLAVAAAINGGVTIKNLRADSEQADKKILEAITSFGANVQTGSDFTRIESQENKSFYFDATECPDLFPPLVSLAVCANGESRINGVHRLKYKESDRELALKTEYEKLGISIETVGDELVIKGGQIKGGKVFSNHDHRIAMALAISGLSSETPVEIEAPECVSKSYTDFFKDLNSLKAAI